MTFLNPLDALIPNIAFSFLSDFWVWVTSEARGSVSVGFWGSCQLTPFFGGGGPAGGLYRPPPPETKTRPPLEHRLQCWKARSHAVCGWCCLAGLWQTSRPNKHQIHKFPLRCEFKCSDSMGAYDRDVLARSLELFATQNPPWVHIPTGIPRTQGYGGYMDTELLRTQGYRGTEETRIRGYRGSS